MNLLLNEEQEMEALFSLNLDLLYNFEECTPYFENDFELQNSLKNIFLSSYRDCIVVQICKTLIKFKPFLSKNENWDLEWIELAIKKVNQSSSQMTLYVL